MENSSSRVVLLEIEIIRRKEIFLSIDIHPISNEFYSKRKFWKDGSRVHDEGDEVALSRDRK